MNIQAPKNEKKKLIPAGALGFSLFFHVALLFLIGGAVLIEGVIPKPTFTEYMPMGETIDDVTEQLPDESLPEEMEPLDSSEPVLEQATSVPDAGASPEIVLMDTPSSSPSFTMPPPNPNAKIGTTPGISSGGAGTKGDVKAVPSSAIRGMSSLFGSKGAKGDALVGFLYDLKQTADKKDSKMSGDGKSNSEAELKANRGYREVVGEFLKKWDPKVFEPYYKSKDALSSYQIFIPKLNASDAPKAFDVQKDVKPSRWVIHYMGNFVAPSSGRFRFVGHGDDILVVRFNRKVVLDSGYTILTSGSAREVLGEVGVQQQKLNGGDWFNMTEGQAYPIEILMGEEPGGAFYTFLMIEEKGKDYEKRKDGTFAYPIFQMAPTKIPKYSAEQDIINGGPAVAKEPFSGTPPDE